MTKECESLKAQSHFLDVVDAALRWDFGKNDTLKFGGKKWTSVMSQKMGEMRKEAKKFCDWRKKKVFQKISASGDFDKWLQKRNLALKPILLEICSNSYSDWKAE